MTDSQPEYTVGGLHEFQKLVCDIFEKWKADIGDGTMPYIWFRGQMINDPLLPGVLRECVNPNTGKVCSLNELKILVTFESLYRNYTSERFERKSSEFFSFMQHYGIPTRLLDWTENAAFALFFAVNNGPHDEDVERVVWVMNPGALNQLTTTKESYAPLVSDVPFVQARMRMVGYIKDGKIMQQFWDKELDYKALNEDCLRLPIAFYPASCGNIRIVTQKGCFTIHGIDRRPIESFFDGTEIKNYLIKVKVQNKTVASIREQLRIMGVTARSVFPDIYGLASELSGPEFMFAQST